VLPLSTTWPEFFGSGDQVERRSDPALEFWARAPESDVGRSAARATHVRPGVTGIATESCVEEEDCRDSYRLEYQIGSGSGARSQLPFVHAVLV
jgi:hypothetical protein